MATGQNFVPPLPLTQPTACRLFDPPYPPKTDSFARDPLRNHRHLAIAPTSVRTPLRYTNVFVPNFAWPCWVAFARLFIRAVALETVVRQNRLYTATEINAAFASGSIS